MSVLFDCSINSVYRYSKIPAEDAIDAALEAGRRYLIESRFAGSVTVPVIVVNGTSRRKITVRAAMVNGHAVAVLPAVGASAR